MLWRDFGRREIDALAAPRAVVFYGAVALLAGRPRLVLLTLAERPRRARVLPRRRRVRLRGVPHLARPAPLRRLAATPRRGRRRRRGGRARRGCPSAGRRRSACRARCSFEASVWRRRQHQVHEVGRLVALEDGHELLVVDPERVRRVVVDRLRTRGRCACARPSPRCRSSSGSAYHGRTFTKG